MKKENLPAILAFSCLTIGIAIAILLPLAVVAVPAEGDRCTTDYVKTLVGSDGGYYYRSGTQTSIKYLKDGTTEPFIHENYDGPRRHYLIMPDGQDNYYGYCIEQGLSFPDANRYTGIGWESDPYLKSLPENIRTGIMLATIYGRQPQKEVPVSGCNDDDWYWATQVVIWEYQQQLRLSPTKIQSNGYVPANYFQSTLDGRPAEKCYNYILSTMENHQKIPSFAAANPADAPMHTLKWDEENSSWHISIHDTNKTGMPIQYSHSSLQLSRNGDEYRFKSGKRIAGATLAVKKEIDLPSHDMLVWGSATGTQSIVTGTADPFTFYMRFRTEEPGTIVILKTSEDGIKEGFSFQLTDPNGKTTSFTTNREGTIRMPLYPGGYRITEDTPQKYRQPQDLNVQIRENETTTLQVMNILKKGKIQLQKTAKDNIEKESYKEGRAKFQVFPIEYPDFDAAPPMQKDEIITDETGIATTKELPLGRYTIHQTGAGDNITLSRDVVGEINEDYQLVFIPIENLMQNGKFEIRKSDKQGNPIPGAVFTVRAAEDIYGLENAPKVSKGALVGTLISGKDGLAITDWLYPGKYNLEEIMTPKGYYPPENPVTTVELTTENRFQQTFTLRSEIINEPVEHVPNTGEILNRDNKEILYSLMLIGLNGMVLMAFLAKERNNRLR